jgi:hypothetical protein
MDKFNIHNWQAEYLKEGSCGYTQDTEGKNLSTPGGTKGRSANSRTQSMKEAEEDSFDARLAKQLDMSPDEFEDQVASRDIGDTNPFMDDDDDRSPGEELASRTIEKLRQQYRGMSDQDMEDFSKEMVLHFLEGSTEAQSTAKVFFAKKGI